MLPGRLLLVGGEGAGHDVGEGPRRGRRGRGGLLFPATQGPQGDACGGGRGAAQKVAAPQVEGFRGDLR